MAEPAFEAPRVARPGYRIDPPQRPNSYREHKADCPLCGSLVSLTKFDGGPYDLAFYVVDVGGAVQPGRVRVTAAGRVVDHSGNSRGSITVEGAWDPQMAGSVEDQMADLCRQIVALADAGNLARPGLEER